MKGVLTEALAEVHAGGSRRGRGARLSQILSLAVEQLLAQGEPSQPLAQLARASRLASQPLAQPPAPLAASRARASSLSRNFSQPHKPSRRGNLSQPPSSQPLAQPLAQSPAPLAASRARASSLSRNFSQPLASRATSRSLTNLLVEATSRSLQALSLSRSLSLSHQHLSQPLV
ncbi:hypothetical protein AMTR_s00040p00227940 [Amborella trichopoda]|uniref:Uncharacterized protein n=1 Tax=Amborella trichopoda TaxID=13333 RepID=W1PY79_AMBTC|nr:hypothetical protein AMTR_s00040p00227940 [Amborella trichopoda]